MVQEFIPTSLGNELGQSIRKGVTEGGEIGFQRGNLRNSLQGLENLPADASAGKLASELLMALQGNPEAGRIFQSAFQPLLQTQELRQRAEADKIADALSSREKKTRETEGRPSGPLSNEETVKVLGEKFFPKIQTQPKMGSPESLKPQRPLTPPSPIGPAEEARLRKELADRGITNAQAVRDQIDSIKQYQKDLYETEKEGFANIEEYQKNRRLNDENFYKDSDPLLTESHGAMTPSEQSIWKELSRQYEDLPNTERFANTEQIYNTLVGGPLIEFENSVRGLPIGSFTRPEETVDRIEDARSSVKDHLKRIEDRSDLSGNLKGLIKNQLRDQYFTAMTAKDYGIAQAAYATSDLSKQAYSSIPEAPPPKETAFESVYLSTPKERDKYTYELANAITKMKPEDSLILMREAALRRNYDDKAFNQALNLAIKNGFSLSDYQGKERNKLSIPQRLDLSSILEGKRSFWDLFKGKL